MTNTELNCSINHEYREGYEAAKKEINASVIEMANIVDVYNDQISAMLDLLQGCDESTDIRTVRTAAEMTLTLFEDMVSDISTILDGGRASDNHKVNKAKEER